MHITFLKKHIPMDLKHLLSAYLHARRVRHIVFPILFLLFTGGCQSFHPPNVSIPMRAPVFTDDADRATLIKATERQLDYLRSLPPNSEIKIGGTSYSISHLTDSLHLFLDIISRNPSPAELDRMLQEKFIAYQAAGRTDSPFGEMLITGYYQPVFAGSLVKTPPFVYPLYAKPRSLLIQKKLKNRKPVIGRRDVTGKIIPYWTRAEIENNRLLEGDELVYLQNPVDVFFLQVQGSGLIRLSNGELRSVHYSASNGREYKSIGKLLVDEGKIMKENISMSSIRNYLDAHPSEIKRILQYNDRFVFFRWENGEPKGSIGETLTPGRSIAVDPSALPMGALAYIISRRPVISSAGEVIGWMPLRRFVLPQDTGTAIKGSGRADIFWGKGPYAELAAGSMKEKGRLYFLVKK